MSAIDTIEHLRVGIFYGLPVYQTLEPGIFGRRNPQDGHKIPPQLNPRFNVEKDCILIGGGSGEHPALAFHDIEHAVARYLEFCNSSRARELPSVGRKAQAAQGSLQTLQYCDWSNGDHIRFRERCAFDFGVYASRLSFEAWLLLNVGEFVLFALPGFSQVVAEWRMTWGLSAEVLFGGIAIPYGTYGGNGKDRFRIVDTLSESANV